MALILLFFNSPFKNERTNLDHTSEVSTKLYLQSADEKTNADGQAYLLVQGKERRLIVQIQNLPAIEGSEVYQVWLLNNGKRANAGTFKPDETGAGVLMYKLAQNEQFDQIGITKEPDSYGTEPRGKRSSVHHNKVRDLLT
ncbi:anti-sigma factor [Bacillus sp. N9]